jgi:uncharacterized membrane protein YoaK (UPF0700 family)
VVASGYAAAGPHPDPTAAIAVGAGMLGVAAMAVQNALVQLALPGAPSTAVMTSNLTRFVLDIVGVLLGREGTAVAQARRRAARTWPAIVGFVVGAPRGAAGVWAPGRATGCVLKKKTRPPDPTISRIPC